MENYPDWLCLFLSDIKHKSMLFLGWDFHDFDTLYWFWSGYTMTVESKVKYYVHKIYPLIV